MDIQTLFYNLREEVSCPVCKDIVTAPRQLPCLHSFCLHCLQHWHQASGGEDAFRCPKCQALSRVPASGNLKDLPASFYLNGLIDVLAIKECSKIQVTCGNCDKKSSEASYCFQCCIFYCEQCLIGHNIMRNNKDHRVLAVKEFQDKDYEDVLKRPAFCPKEEHQKEEMRYFCKTCETAVCQTCVNLHHVGHPLTLIKEEAEAQKIEMTALIQDQRDFLQKKMNVVAQLDDDYAKVLQQGENVIRDVEKHVNSLIKTIEVNKQNIITAVENKIKKSLESVTTKKDEIQKEIKVLESSLKKADKLLARITNAEIVQLRKTLQTLFEGVDQTKPIARDPEGLLALVFVENQRMLDTVNGQEIGYLEDLRQTKASECVAEGKGLNEGTVGREAQFNLITRNSERKQCYNNHDNVTVKIRDEQGRECATKRQIDDNKGGVYNISYSPTVQGRCKLSIKVNGEHVRGSPFTVLVVNPFHVEPVYYFGTQGSAVEMFQYPMGVAVNHRDEIAVADYKNHKVQIFNSDGNFIRSFGCRGSNQGEFENPLGIAFDEDGKIFVADSDNHRIQIFSGEGGYMRMFGGEGSLDSQLSCPWGLSVDSHGNIIVADTGNTLIKIFSPDGNFLMKIGGPGSFSLPVHCVQCDEYLIVSDRDDPCMKVFTREGEYKYKFGKQGEGDGEFKNPFFLSVTKTGLIMVCDEGNHRIQVFELNGKFVGKFGRNGNNLGEFNYPRAVAVLSNNLIVVSDCGNHRLQIFD